MSPREAVEQAIVAGLDDPQVLETVEAECGQSALPEAEAILASLNARAGLTNDDKRDRSALVLEIVTRRAIVTHDLAAAVNAQKALATLEGLEIDPAIAQAKKIDELPMADIEARIREILKKNPELRAALMQDA